MSLPAPFTIGRSLWSEARARFLVNRAALASLIVLGAIALAAVVGPHFTGHAYDRVYQDYVRVAPSHSAHPNPAELEQALARIGARLRARIERQGGLGDTVTLRLVAERPIDERMLALFERSDMLGTARIVERRDEGRSLVVDVPVRLRRFLLGTDSNGRDLLTRTLIAGRVSLAIGLLAALVALVIGVAYGSVAGFLGGRTDQLMMRLVDVLYALPFIFFVILLVVFFGRNFILMFLAVGAIEWLDMARIVRGQTLSIRRRKLSASVRATSSSVTWCRTCSAR